MVGDAPPWRAGTHREFAPFHCTVPPFWTWHVGCSVSERADETTLGGKKLEMTKWHGWAIVFGLCLGGCNIETYDHGSGPLDDETCESATPSNSDGCQRNSDCASASYCDVALGHCVASASCSSEIDCDASMNCDSVRSTCVPATDPTCAEVTNESACVTRGDCTPLYAGVDCSCGPDCACKGGEPDPTSGTLPIGGGVGFSCIKFELFRQFQ